MEKENPSIEWCNVKDKECLKFTFTGQLTYSGAKKAVEKWTQIFAEREGRKIRLVWLCLDMTGYEPASRAIWQKTIKDLKGQIDSIWLITNSRLITAGAKILSIFTSFPIKVVRSVNEIEMK